MRIQQKIQLNGLGVWHILYADKIVLGDWRYYSTRFKNIPTESEIKEFKIQARKAFYTLYLKRSNPVYRIYADNLKRMKNKLKILKDKFRMLIYQY